MTRDQLVKRSIKGYMGIDYQHPSMNIGPVECFLTSVDYNEEILRLQVVDELENPLSLHEFTAHISHCEFSKPKPKELKIIRNNSITLPSEDKQETE